MLKLFSVYYLTPNIFNTLVSFNIQETPEGRIEDYFRLGKLRPLSEYAEIHSFFTALNVVALSLSYLNSEYRLSEWEDREEMLSINVTPSMKLTLTLTWREFRKTHLVLTAESPQDKAVLVCAPADDTKGTFLTALNELITWVQICRSTLANGKADALSFDAICDKLPFSKLKYKLGNTEVAGLSVCSVSHTLWTVTAKTRENAEKEMSLQCQTGCLSWADDEFTNNLIDALARTVERVEESSEGITVILNDTQRTAYMTYGTEGRNLPDCGYLKINKDGVPGKSVFAPPGLITPDELTKLAKTLAELR